MSRSLEHHHRDKRAATVVFDPRTAPDRQLLRHGFPRRPNARSEAEWRARWDKALARPIKWLVPKFREMKGRSHGPMRPSGRKARVAPAGEVAITNLAVSPGDVMHCLLCVNSTTAASVYFTNQSSGVGTRFTIPAPSGTTLAGNCAEWIVERPTIGGAVASLTDFDVVYLDECMAG